MSQEQTTQDRIRWGVTHAKMYGWLTGLAIAMFGALMCSVPAGAVIGIPVVMAGLMLSFSFSVTMSATRLHPLFEVFLVVVGLALIVFGRYASPLVQIYESFRLEQTVLRSPSAIAVFGFPLMMLGLHLVQLCLPWVRDPNRLSGWRSFVSVVLLQAASLVLVIGALRTGIEGVPGEKPMYVMWAIVPILVALGVGLRTHWRGLWWLVMCILMGLALPAVWYAARYSLSHPAGEGSAVITTSGAQKGPVAPASVVARQKAEAEAKAAAEPVEPEDAAAPDTPVQAPQDDSAQPATEDEPSPLAEPAATEASGS